MPTKGFPHRAIPSGWFQVGWSEELAEPGADVIKRMRYFGRDLVMYRAASGQVVVLDAYCPHMGAHLGYGGTVCGNAIQCPYHGWQWGPAGENVQIPYSAKCSPADWNKSLKRRSSFNAARYRFCRTQRWKSKSKLC